MEIREIAMQENYLHPSACIHRLFLGLAVLIMGVGLSSAQERSLDRSAGQGWAIEKSDGRLEFRDGKQQIAVFHYRDSQCLRPFFSEVRTSSGQSITRNYPPVAGVDPEDHASMHGGIWLAFGDINGEDFWRNKGQIQHRRFIQEPLVNDQGISFACEDALIDSKGKTIGMMDQSYRIRRIGFGYTLDWIATIRANEGPIALGDQEEMGLGVRVSTSMTEKNDGKIQNSTGAVSAKQTWGKIAAWSDYSKIADGKRVGVLLQPDAKNFKPSWFHNRDYGLMVANCFGSKSFTGGEPSSVKVAAGESLKIAYRVYWYECGATDELPIDALSAGEAQR